MKTTLTKSLLAVALGAAFSVQAAPTLIENVQGYTLNNDKMITFSGLLFDNGKVIATGDAAKLRKAHPDAQRIDGKGKTLLPGLIDAHGHVFRLGYRVSEVGLVGSKSLQDAQNSIATYAKANPNAQWILGRGWNQVIWKMDRFPTAAELDAAVSDRPVALIRVDGHAAWVNTKALQLAGITKDTPDPVGGKIERDANGNPNGILVDKARAYLDKVIPPYTDDQRRASLTAALDHFKSLGLTSVGDAGATADDYRIYREFADQGKLTTRVNAMISDTADNFKVMSANGPIPGYANDRLNLISLKLYTDGALGSRGAAMLEPYSDAHDHKGLLFMDDKTLRDKMRAAFKAGFQVNAHAIGDGANHQLLDAFEAVYKENNKWSAFRNRIEHAQIVTLKDIPRFLDLDLIASMQPTHATSDMNMAEDRVGKNRLKGAYAWKTFLKQGTVISCGSDFPVESANPFFGLHSAITRTDHEGKPIGGWHAEEAMTKEQAFRCFTLDAAYGGHMENVIGSLEPGKYADFILIDQNIFKVKPTTIWKTKVLETWLAGQRVYQAK